MLEKRESREVIGRAIDLGINYFDTANTSSYGESERILGDAIRCDQTRDVGGSSM